MKKILAMLLVLTMVLALLPATAAAENPKELLFFTAFIGDFGLSDMGNRATDEIAEKYGMNKTLVEYGSYDAALAVNCFWDALETKHYDYFVGPDWYIADILNDAAADYPDTTFILYDTGRDTQYVGDNIYGISFAQNESSFVAAILQALMTKTGKIGVLSSDGPILNDFSTGWLTGARYAKEQMGLDVTYFHSYMPETSMSAVYEMMNVMYDNGCDVVWPITAQMMLAAAQAAEEHGGIENNYFVMGCDYDQYSYFHAIAEEQGSESAVGHENIVTSITKNITNCCVMIIDSIETGSNTIPTGNKLYHVFEGGVGILENDYYLEKIPQEVRDTIADIIAKVGTGEIEVPSYFDFPTYDDFAAFRDMAQ